MSYSDSIEGPLTKSKREKLYQGILDLLSDKCRSAFDTLNKNNLDKWNKHSFDVTYIMASFKTFEELQNCGDNYIIMAGISSPGSWPIFLEDRNFALEISNIYKNDFNKLSIERQKDMSPAFDIFKSEYPDLFR